MPLADFVGPARVTFGQAIDRAFKVLSPIQSFVHAQQIDLLKQAHALCLSQSAVIKTLGIPFDQDATNIKNDGINRHSCLLAG